MASWENYETVSQLSFFTCLKKSLRLETKCYRVDACSIK